MDEQKDDVKIKNISEILSENLRILEQKNIPKNDDDILEKNSKKPLKELTYDRVQFSEDDLDVELLDLKDIHSKKALKKIRKLLHREIRDRVLQPFQKKQSEINKKLVQNFTEVYSELDFSSEQVDRNIRNIEFLLKESEKLNDSLDKKISDTQTDLDKKISDTQTDLDKKISDTQTDLDKKISDTQTDLDKKISKMEINLDERLEPKISKKIDELTRTNLETQSEIFQAYQELLDRQPDIQGLQHYFYKTSIGELSIEDLKNELKSSNEFSKNESETNFLKKYQSKVKKPIFIIGVPRSGTTFLHSILCAHKDLAWVSDKNLEGWVTPFEKYNIDSYYKWLKSRNKKIPITEKALLIFGQSLGKGLRDFGVPPPGRKEIPIEGELFWRKIFGSAYIEDITTDKKIIFVKEIIDIFKKQEKERFLCKAPQNVMRLPALKKIFPDSIFINIARDPRSVVSSMIKRHNTEGSFETGISILDKQTYQELDFIQKWAWQYKEITDAIHDFSKAFPDSILTIFYEDLLENPQNVLKKIFSFCDLEIPENFDKMIPYTRKGTVDKWQKNITKEDVKKIFSLIDSSLKNMVYPYSNG